MKQNLEKMLLDLKGATVSYPFGPEVLVYKTMGKMFALIAEGETTPRINLKCVPADAEMLVSEYKSIIPGYHMNKKHWITVSLMGDVPEDMLVDLINDSYDLVVSKLTKADRALLAGQ